MKVLKVLGNCSLVFLAVLGVLTSISYLYVIWFVKDITIGVNNVGDQVAVDIKKADELTQAERDIYEDRWFMHANYYSNDKKNGIELQELNFNYFMSTNLLQEDYRSSGMQYLGDFKTTTNYLNSEEEANNYRPIGFYYYDTTNGISWSGTNSLGHDIGTILNRNEEFIIKLDNRAFSIKLDGKTEHWGNFLWWSYITETIYYDYGDVFECVFNAIESNNKGYGDYYITLDLSSFFSIKEYDYESKKFKTDDVTDVIKNYAVLKFHYDENGALNSNQSLFGQIKCNSNFGVQEDVNTDYWQERVVYTLTDISSINGKSLFDYRYSEKYKGYFVSLNLESKNMFEKMPRTKVNVCLDLNSEYLKEKGINIVGFDYNGFEGLEIDTIQIVGDSQTFYLLDKSLYNTNFQRLEHSKGITFEFAENSINNEYVGVII